MKKKTPKSRITLELKDGPVDDLVKAIKDDHKDLKGFIKVMKDDDATPGAKKSAADSFMALLKSHSSSEEKALYAKCLKVKDLRVMADEGFVEHGVAANLMKSMPKPGKNKDRYVAQVKVLAEVVEHHIEEEEEEFLPKVEKHFATKKQVLMAKEFFTLRKRSQKKPASDNAGVLRA